MNKKMTLYLTIIVVLLLIVGLFQLFKKEKKEETKTMEATVLTTKNDNVTIIDQQNSIYTLHFSNEDIQSGDLLTIEYAGILDHTKGNQTIEVINYAEKKMETDKNGIPVNWKDDGIFSKYYIMAFNKLKELTLDEKIGQLLLVRYTDNAVDILKKYPISGFVFFEKDFKDKSKKQVQDMIKNLQKNSKIPLLTSVDEEGGKVVRVSSNPNLATEKFKSPKELYDLGGFEAIKKDTKEKSRLLKDLGLNLNLAPVVDVSTNPNDYIYPRTLGKGTDLTSTYAKTVIESSKDTGVSYTLKHFPGYGNNIDTHTGSAVDTRTYDEILKNDIPPFEAGIKAGAEAVLVSHNIVKSMDENNPASLSASVHNILRNNLKFTGVIITDDIAMNALDKINNVTLQALLAGNDLIITTDYQTSFNELKTNVQNNTIDETIIDQHVLRILAWKYYKEMPTTK
jgi:beta-N-acetylhexosaminidase